LLDGVKVGFYTLRPTGEELALDHLYLQPNCQSQGIGSVVMRRLVAEANAERLPIRLGALRESDSNRFYQRHGFVQTSEDEFDIYYVRRPSPTGVV
jgi:GNAT superfamily N-acetyltransferase